jgi:mRNA-degrading endonuclease RelE of RelBE toxin-antitoxin system
MVDRGAYRRIFAAATAAHLDAIDRRHHSLIRSTIAEQLAHEPARETRNRKPLKQPMGFGATWELRFGPRNRFRVFYHIDEEQREVVILAIGVKERNRLFIGGEETEE